MGQGTESSETCADRPTEVSVIRFVSRNRTIEEIAPKKEVYICKQRGCGKVFTNLEEFKTHEALEALKIRFICREPGCGEELSDPGSMWRHYQEWHNNETNVLVCPYTSCGSVHASSEILEEHIESSHRQLPTIPTEPEIICFEGTDNVIEDDISRISADGNSGYDGVRGTIKEAADSGVVRKNEYASRNNETIVGEYNVKEENRIVSTKEGYPPEQSKLRAALTHDDYSKNNETHSRIGAKFPKNKDLLITKENFYVKYEARSPVCTNENVQIDSSSQDGNNTVFVNNDVSLAKTTPSQEHRIELGNLEKVFRSGFEQDSAKPENTREAKSSNNCDQDDEEYTPKKQRMSRSKQEPYRCEVDGCGKTYKYISHFRHHQETHKFITNTMNASLVKTTQKAKAGKSLIVSFFLCKMPGCGAQLSNVNTLWKHYQETHANAKPPVSLAKCTEIYRCKITGCEMEFPAPLMLYKHFNEVHSKNALNNTSASNNGKTGNGSRGGVLVEPMFRDGNASPAAQQQQRANFKTDLKAKHAIGSSEDENCQSSVAKEASGD